MVNHARLTRVSIACVTGRIEREKSQNEREREKAAILPRPIRDPSASDLLSLPALVFPLSLPIGRLQASASTSLKQQKVNKSFIHFLHSSFPVNVLFYNDNETAILFKMTVLLVKLKEPRRFLLFTFIALGKSDTNINITVTAYLTKTIPIKNTAHNLILCYYINKCFRMSFTYLH